MPRRKIIVLVIALAAIVLAAVLFVSFLKTESSLDSTRRLIVYILPSAFSDTYWKETYGDRIYFYVKEDLSEQRYQEAIASDFQKIKTVYNTVILIVPAEDTDLYFNNLRKVNEMARQAELKVMYGIFPKWKYGPEGSYLEQGSRMNQLVLEDMAFMAGLSQTWKIGVWVSWSGPKIVDFYKSLPDHLRDKYAVWVDELNVLKVFPWLLSEDVLVVTEIYHKLNLPILSGLFKNQIVITGEEDANSPQDWLSAIKSKIKLILRGKRMLGIWIFNDKGNGHKENFSAYFPGQDPELADPWH